MTNSRVAALPAEQLCWRCDPASFGSLGSGELKELDQVLGQDRAIQAVRFGVGIRHDGFNVFVLGPSGMGKRTAVRSLLEEKAPHQSTPVDWCYVNNFDQPHKPRALSLPAGRGSSLRDKVQRLIEDLQAAIPAALEGEELRNRLGELEQEFKERHDKAFGDLSNEAEAKSIRLVRTPGGFALAPLVNAEVLSPEEFDKLPEEEKSRIEADVKVLEEKLQALVRQLPQWRKETHDKVKKLSREVTQFAISHLLTQVRAEFADLAEVVEYLNAFERDVLDNADDFRVTDEERPTLFGVPMPSMISFHRYQVNLLVDNGSASGAPIVFEDNPTYQNLVGRIEHESQMGALVTEFNLIKPGALHRANGGYLIVEAYKLLTQPYAWEGLKRALRSRDMKIESLGQALSLISTVSLEPEPIPLDVKVVLLGDRMLYYLLYEYDPDFTELFKVEADFDDRMERSDENCALYARFIASLARREKLLPLDPSAVARVIEQGARAAEDSERLSTHLRTVCDLLREADYWAAQAGSAVVTAEHVEAAVKAQIHRADRVRHRIYEEIQRGTVLIDTQDRRVGQINGLSVLGLGNFSFGQPTRITATARLGKGEVIDIEREVKLGGAIHSKGVLILSSFLAQRYAADQALSLSASLVFEQSYGMVDGDSAGTAELCVLLSAISGLPLRQDLAVTGSVNQLGQTQAIGGVNEKIEGFFDVCRQRGLTGTQGVVIPASNVKHLMLRSDVVQAAREGTFHIYPVSTIDEAISVLFDRDPGSVDKDGNYPPQSVNHAVRERLLEFSKKRKELADSGSKKEAL